MTPMIPLITNVTHWYLRSELKESRRENGWGKEPEENKSTDRRVLHCIVLVWGVRGERGNVKFILRPPVGVGRGGLTGEPAHSGLGEEGEDATHETRTGGSRGDDGTEYLLDKEE